MSGEDLLVLFSVAALEALLSGDNALVLAAMVRPLPKLSAREFWRVVLLINLVDLAFAVDSILAVVAFSKDLLLVFLGVALGILFIRLAASYVVAVMERYPGLERVAYALVGWAGVKLLLEGSTTLAELMHRPELAWHLPKPAFWSITFLILVGGSLLALRKHA